jgi:ribosomal protein S18 acetylase RimI-like enzyme
MQNRFFSSKHPELTFDWNSANPSDWPTIRRNFVAAYICSYIDRSFDELMYTNEQVQAATDKWDTIYKKFLTRGMPFIQQALIDPLKFYLHHQTEPLQVECAELARHLQDKNHDISAVREKIIKLIMLSSYFENDFDEEMHKIAAGNKKIDYLITRFHNQPIAFFVCELNYKSGNIYLRFVTMEPAFHRQGLGQLILNQITKKHPEAIGMELYTRIANHPAKSFYASNGFKDFEQFEFGKPEVSLKPIQTLYFPDDDGTSHPEAFIAFRKARR